MQRSILSSAFLAFFAALGTAQTYVQTYAPGTFSYSGVSGDERRVQLADADGNSRLVRSDGTFVHSNAGYVGALGVSDGGREFLGVAGDASMPLPLGYVRRGDDAYPTALGDGQGLHRGVIDAVSGRVAFLAYDGATNAITWGIDTGSGPATPIQSDGTVGVNGFAEITSVSPAAFTGLGYDGGFNVQAFWNDGAFHQISLPSTAQGFQSLRVNQDPNGNSWLTAVVWEGAMTWGTSWAISGGNAIWSGLRVAGATGVTEAWGGRSAFWGESGVWAVDLPTSAVSEITTASGGPLAGVTSGFARGSGFYLSGSFGAGTVQAVPEPATLAALGLGLAMLSRRRHSS